MDQIYAWLLMFLLRPSVQAELPPDTLLLIDPMDPMESSLFVDAVFTDIPDGVVTDLCLVESGGCKKPISIHSRDGWTGANALPGMKKRGRLPGWCPFFWGIEDHPVDLATRGNHGQIAAYSLHYLGPCIPPDALDVPLYSALRAGLRAREVCRRKYNRQSKEIRAGERGRDEREACTSEDVRHAWAGYGKSREKVVAKWHDRLAFWRPLARWRTDWRGRCRKAGRCSSALANRPALKDFRRKAEGKALKW